MLSSLSSKPIFFFAILFFIGWYLIQKFIEIYTHGGIGRTSVDGTVSHLSDKEIHNLYLSGVFQLAGYIGRSTSDENPYRNAIVQEYIRQLSTSPESAELCQTAFFAGFARDYSPMNAVRLLERYTQFSKKKPNIKYLMNFVVTIALCDGVISSIEDQRLNELCKLLKFSPRELRRMIDECRRMQSWKNFAPNDEFAYRGAFNDHWKEQRAEGWNRQQYEEQKRREEEEKRREEEERRAQREAGRQMDVLDAYQVLGVPASASDREIKKAFHRLIRKYHPDLAQARGFPEEMTQVYADRAQTINQAYETICRDRAA